MTSSDVATIPVTRAGRPLEFISAIGTDEVVYDILECSDGETGDKYHVFATSKADQILDVKFGVDAGYAIDTQGLVYRWIGAPKNFQLLADHHAIVTRSDDETICIRVFKFINGVAHRIVYRIGDVPLKLDRSVTVEMVDLDE